MAKYFPSGPHPQPEEIYPKDCYFTLEEIAFLIEGKDHPKEHPPLSVIQLMSDEYLFYSQHEGDQEPCNEIATILTKFYWKKLDPLSLKRIYGDALLVIPSELPKCFIHQPYHDRVLDVTIHQRP